MISQANSVRLKHHWIRREPIFRMNECTEAAISDLWNVWGESARRTHCCFPEFLLSWTSEFLTMQLHRIPVLLLL